MGLAEDYKIYIILKVYILWKAYSNRKAEVI
jgi:hypothetical protein